MYSIISYHKVSGLKQYPFILVVSVGPKSRQGLAGFSAQGLSRPHFPLKMLAGLCSHLETGPWNGPLSGSLRLMVEFVSL